MADRHGEDESMDDEVFDMNDGEEIVEDNAHAAGDEDMDLEEEEIQLENDSAAYMDQHTDSVFTIAVHPVHDNIFASGGGDDVGYVWEGSIPEPPVLPSSFEASPSASSAAREGIKPFFKIEGHTDSVAALAFSLPKGEYLVSGGLDGRLQIFRDGSKSLTGLEWKLVQSVQEVEEVVWIAPCPHPDHPNVVALGANDGSVWVYDLESADEKTPPVILQAYYLHKGSVTAGSFTPDGRLLCTCSDDSSLYVWDVFDDAKAAGGSHDGQSIIGFTDTDKRFAVDGGLFSLAVSPNSGLVAVGGADGNLRIVSLPRLDAEQNAKPKAGAKSGKASGKAGAASSQAGQILLASAVQKDSIETLSFSPASSNLLACGSVDGSIAILDIGRNFAVRRHIEAAHEGAVVQVRFAEDTAPGSWLLYSVGIDGVLRRFNNRNNEVKEWKGHQSAGSRQDQDQDQEQDMEQDDGDRGGILSFVMSGKGQVTTAGDEGVCLVFNTAAA